MAHDHPNASGPGVTVASSDPARSLLRFGWWALLVFLSLGLVLEALHGFKVGAYLDVSNQTRRLMWTLAHAHGTLLAMIDIAFALTLPSLEAPATRLATAARLLRAATLLLPTGFFVGGIFIHSGDPGVSIVLVPIGGVVLLLGVLLTARSVDATAAGSGAGEAPDASPRPKSGRRPRR